MLHFEYSTLISAPVERVFAFHEEPGALEALTPPGQSLTVLHREGGIQPGGIVVLKVRLGPFPVVWRARHTEYEQNRLFVDVQDSGPFRYWKHRHQFAPESGGTRLTDSIEFSLHGGPLADLAGGWIAKRQLRAMFEHRHRVTAERVRR